MVLFDSRYPAALYLGHVFLLFIVMLRRSLLHSQACALLCVKQVWRYCQNMASGQFVSVRHILVIARLKLQAYDGVVEEETVADPGLY
jgi:hypothetical protein